MNENIRVLIVEDQLIVAEDIRMRLEKHGLQVTGMYAEGEEAINNFISNNPDLVLMDINLAGKIDGIATAESLKRLKDVPVIYLSELNDADTLKRARTTMPDNYLTKPFNEADLIRAIDLAFYNARHRQAITRSEVVDAVFLRTESQSYVKLRVEDILILRADRAYCNVVCRDKTYILSTPMNQVAVQINSHRLVRAHRSFMVNIDHITGIEGNTIQVGDHEVPMSKEWKDDIVGRLKFVR